MFPVHGCSESLAGRKLKKEDYLLFILFCKKAIFRAEHRHWCFSPSLFTCPCGRGSIPSKCKTYTFYLNSKKRKKYSKKIQEPADGWDETIIRIMSSLPLLFRMHWHIDCFNFVIIWKKKKGRIKVSRKIISPVRFNPCHAARVHSFPTFIACLFKHKLLQKQEQQLDSFSYWRYSFCLLCLHYPLWILLQVCFPWAQHGSYSRGIRSCNSSSCIRRGSGRGMGNCRGMDSEQ